MEFNDLTVMITGAAGLLGRASARSFAQAGARVLLFDCDPSGLDNYVRSLKEAGLERVLGMVGDVRSASSIQSALATLPAAWRPVRILVNFAGFPKNTPFLEISESEWNEVFDVNVKGTFLTCQAIANNLAESGCSGAIVNISSIAAMSARPGSVHYSASKAAVSMLTETLALDLAPYNIRVNAVAPGVVLDRVIDQSEADSLTNRYERETVSAVPLGRTGDPAEVAEAVLFLASERRAGWITGTVLSVTGGMHCGRTTQSVGGSLTSEEDHC